MMKASETKKPKLLLNQPTRNALKINFHEPHLSQMKIIQLTPVKPLQEDSSLIKLKSQSKVQNKGRNSPGLPNAVVRISKIRSLSNKIRKERNKLEISQKFNFQNVKSKQQQILTKKLEISDDKISTQNAQSIQKQTNQAQFRFIQSIKFQNIKNIHERRYTCPPFAMIKLYPTTLTICNVLNESIFFNNSCNIKLKKADSFELKNMQGIQWQQQMSHNTKTYQCSNDRLDQLTDLIIEKQSLLARRQWQVYQAETRLTQLKQAIAKHEQQIQKYIIFNQQTLSMQWQMQNYLDMQACQQLREDVKEYKQCEQSLIELDEAHQFETYQELLWDLSKEIEEREEKLFQNINNFHIKSKIEKDQVAINTLKENIGNIYHNIMNKINVFLKQNNDNFKHIFKAIRAMALHTIKKREYLDQINNKMINLAAFSERALRELKSLQNSPSKQVDIVKKIVHAMKNAYNEAQIYY